MNEQPKQPPAVVAIGTLTGFMDFIGPFETVDAAMVWARTAYEHSGFGIRRCEVIALQQARQFPEKSVAKTPTGCTISPHQVERVRFLIRQYDRSAYSAFTWREAIELLREVVGDVL